MDGVWWWWWWWWWCTRVNYYWIVAGPVWFADIYSADFYICVFCFYNPGVFLWGIASIMLFGGELLLIGDDPSSCSRFSYASYAFTMGIDVYLTIPKWPSLFIICVRPLNRIWNSSGWWRGCFIVFDSIDMWLEGPPAAILGKCRLFAYATIVWKVVLVSPFEISEGLCKRGGRWPCGLVRVVVSKEWETEGIYYRLLPPCI